MVATLAFLILPSWNTWKVYRSSAAASDQELQLQRLVGNIVHLDEVLTMSAWMAAVTGETRWVERYRRHEPLLEAAIDETIQHAAGAYTTAAARTEAANRKLVDFEKHALQLIEAGKLQEAQGLLRSKAYNQQKGDYADGMLTLTATIDAHIQRDVDRSGRRLLGAGALTLLSAGTLVLAWVGVVVLIWRHLIARDRAEEERRKHEAQLEHVQKLESLGVMAGGIAHDFNNLLMPILGNVELALADLPPDSPTISGLRNARDAGRRLSELTNQLLTYSGSVALDPRPIDVSRLIDDSRALLEIVHSKKAELRFELADELPPIKGDTSQILQVVLNLVTNASEAVGGGEGTIEVRTRVLRAGRENLGGDYFFEDLPEGPYVCLEVSDSGAGIDAATRRQIFDPFFTTKFTGRGLGLAVVLRIVIGHRGAIRVDSEKGRGTRFRILFPTTEDTPEAPLAPRDEREEPWRFDGTALVVDDEAPLLAIAERMLGRFGFSVLLARDGREALETFRKHADEIDVVLLDLTMPGLGGAETLREIHALRADQRVVIMSGYSQDFAASSLDGGIAGFLQKPFTFEQLGETLRALLSQP